MASDSVHIARFCDAIGANTNLQKLDIRSAHELVDMAANNGAFSEGLKRNASINELWLANCDLSTGMGREILNGFVVNNSNLKTIVLHQCALGNGGTGILASAIRRCTNLTDIWLLSCDIDVYFGNQRTTSTSYTWLVLEQFWEGWLRSPRNPAARPEWQSNMDWSGIQPQN